MQMDKKRKTIIKIFKHIGFSIDIQTNLKEVDFLDIILTYKIAHIVHTKT